MYCKKCKYHSFDHISACPKCGVEWDDIRKALNLDWMTAGGINWINPEKSGGQTEIIMSPLLAAEHNLDFGHTAQEPHTETDAPILSAPPSAISRTPDIEISLSPDLDFSAPPAPPSTVTRTPDIEIPLSPDLDFSAPPAPPAGSGGDSVFLDAQPETSASKKYGDSFLPELEEMLAPLGGERSGGVAAKAAKPKPWGGGKAGATPKFEHEVDSLLDFVSSSSTQDDDFLSLHIEEKDK